MSEIVIVTNLGQFESYYLVENINESPKLEEIEIHRFEEAHQKISDIMADQQGRFGRGRVGNTVIKGAGERHNIELEQEKKIIKQIAEKINTLIKEIKPKKWYLAADGAINNRVVELLSDEAKAILAKNIKSNLTKIGMKELIALFKEG